MKKRRIYTDSWQPVAQVLPFVPTESEQQMMHMMALVGLDPALAVRGDSRVQAIMHEARYRFQNCPAEQVCNTWLTSESRGDNDFCPNAWMFRNLANEQRKTA